MKKQLEVKNKHTNNERRLFHGTGATSIDLINKQGFNRSYAGAHGNQTHHTTIYQFGIKHFYDYIVKKVQRLIYVTKCCCMPQVINA